MSNADKKQAGIPEEHYRALRKEIERGFGKDLNEHDPISVEATRKAFSAAGLTMQEHDDWREEVMSAAMGRILDKIFDKKNSARTLKKMSIESGTDWHMWYKYQQEVDMDGITDEDWAARQPLRYPTRTLCELEAYAAEEYIKTKTGLTIRIERWNGGPPHDTGVMSTQATQNDNPIISYDELVKEIHRDKTLIDTGAARKACDRCIEKTFDKKTLPQRIQKEGYTVGDYQLVELGDQMKKNGYPSATCCKYQKISKTNLSCKPE